MWEQVELVKNYKLMRLLWHGPGGVVVVANFDPPTVCWGVMTAHDFIISANLFAFLGKSTEDQTTDIRCQDKVALNTGNQWFECIDFK